MEEQISPAMAIPAATSAGRKLKVGALSGGRGPHHGVSATRFPRRDLGDRVSDTESRTRGLGHGAPAADGCFRSIPL